MFDPDYDLFLAIVEAGSISGAARSRGLSTAAVSKRLVRLEQGLAARLINRTTRRLVLTAAGQDLLDTLLPMRAQLAATTARIAGRADELAGPLRLTAPTSFGRMQIVPLLPSFLARYPAIALSIDLSDEFVDLLDGRHDVAIRIAARIGPGLVSHRLGTSRRVFCAAPAYLAQFGEPQRLGDLARHRLLATESQLPWLVDGPQGSEAVHGQSHVRTNSSEVVRELAIGACGIALRSLWDVSDALASGALRRVLPDYEGTQDVGIFAVHPPGPALPARIAALIDHFAAHLPRTMP